MKRLIRITACVLPLILLCCSVCYADEQDISALQDQQDASYSELESTQEQIEELEAEKSGAELDLEQLHGQLSSLTEEYDALQTQYEDGKYRLRLLREDLKEAQAEQDEQRNGMKIRIQYMYENTSDSGMLASLFDGGIGNVLSRADQISELEKYDRQMLGQYEETCEQIEQQEQQVREEQERILSLREESRAKQAEIRDLIDETAEQIRSYEEELQDREEHASELLETIRLQEETLQALLLQEQQAALAAVMQQSSAAAQTYESSGMGGQSWAGTEYTGSVTGADEAVTWEEPAAEAPAAEVPAEAPAYSDPVPDNGWNGSVLSQSAGVNMGPSGKETYYNLDMSGIVSMMRGMGNSDPYWVRDDGVKMLGDYVMVAANLDTHPRGSIVESSLGTAIVCDTGGFAYDNPNQLDIATAW